MTSLFEQLEQEKKEWSDFEKIAGHSKDGCIVCHHINGKVTGLCRAQELLPEIAKRIDEVLFQHGASSWRVREVLLGKEAEKTK